MRSFIISNLHQILLLGWSTQEGITRSAGSMHRNFSRKACREEPSVRHNVDVRITFRWIVDKLDITLSTRFIWIRKGISGGVLHLSSCIRMNNFLTSRAILSLSKRNLLYGVA